MHPLAKYMLRRYAVFFIFPVAVVFGCVGSYIEGLVSDRYTPCDNESVLSKRLARQLREKPDLTISLKDIKRYVPASILDKNLSPNLVDIPSTNKK